MYGMDNQRPVKVTAIAQTNKPQTYPKVDDEATILVEYPKAQGIIPAPEPNHAIRAVIDEAVAAREAGEEKVILFNLCGHGHFDMQAYDDYTNGRLPEFELSVVVEPVEAMPRATDAANLEAMGALVTALDRNGHTYRSDGSVYFKISTLPEYGKLAKRDHEGMKPGARRMQYRTRRSVPGGRCDSAQHRRGTAESGGSDGL